MAKKAAKKPVKTKDVNFIKKHLGLTISVPVVVLVLVLALVMVRVPYTAKESYIEYVDEQVPVRKVVEDTDNPIQERVCEDKLVTPRIVEDPFSPYMRPYGLYDYMCYSELRVYNDGEEDGKWTIRYIFEGKLVVTSPDGKSFVQYTRVGERAQ